MRTSKDILNELDRLFDLYQEEINSLLKKGIITCKTAGTYLTHSNNFTRWCKGEFTPGGKNMQGFLFKKK